MSGQLGYFAAGAAAIIVLCLSAFFARGKVRAWLGNVLLLALTLFVGAFFFVAVGNHKLGTKSSTVAADQSEMQLRVVAMARAFQAELDRFFQQAAGPHPLPKVPTAQADAKVEASTFDSAESSLWKVEQQNPDVQTYKAKLVVLLGNRNPDKHKAEIKQLISQMQSAPVTDAASKTMHGLADLFRSMYIDCSVKQTQLGDGARTIKTSLESGWFRDQAMLKMYECAHDAAGLKAQQLSVQKRYFAAFLKILLVGTIFIGSALIGLIIIGVQAALASRKGQPPLPDAVGLNVPLKTIYAVFVAWFSCQIAMSLAFHALSSKLSWLSEQAVGVSLGTAIVYLASNIAGPLLIYYLALKPQGLNFWDALRFRLRTSTAGPGKLILSGFMGWCSAIPLVAGSALLASKLLDLQGSDNPVLGQIMQAATASSLAATFVFYFTLGVMAPFFEEMLFRGFLYSSLKTRIGTTGAMFASAALFAFVHFDSGGLFSLFAIGLVLAYVFERTRSLVPSMLTHGLWNSGTFTFALLVFGS